MMRALQTLADANPDALRLARFASLASRVEPELLRALRLELCEETNAAAEADLWWSRVVDVRSPTGIRLSAEALEELRAGLGTDAARAYAVIQRVHAQVPRLQQLEESLVYGSLSGTDTLAVTEQLRQVLGTLLNDAKRAGHLASWVVQAFPRLPRAIRELPAFWSVLFAADAQGRGTPNVSAQPSLAVLDQALTLTPSLARAGWVSIEATLDDDQLFFKLGAVVEETSQGILALNVQPVLLDVFSAAGRSVVLVEPDGFSKPLKVAGDSIVVRSLGGRTHQLGVVAEAAQASSARKALQVFSAFPSTDAVTEARTAYLVGGNLLVTAASHATVGDSWQLREGDVEGEAEVVSFSEDVQLVLLWLNRLGTKDRLDMEARNALALPLASSAVSVHLTRSPTFEVRHPMLEHSRAAVVALSPTPKLRFEHQLRSDLMGAPVIVGDEVAFHVARFNGEEAELCPASLVLQALEEARNWLEALDTAQRFEELLLIEAEPEKVAALRQRVLFEQTVALRIGETELERCIDSERAGRRWLALVVIGQEQLKQFESFVLQALKEPRNDFERAEASTCAERLGLRLVESTELGADERALATLRRRLSQASIPERRGDQLLFAVWHLGKRRPRSRIRAALELAAEVLRRFDVTLIDEVGEPEDLAQMVEILGPGWELVTASSDGASAFLIIDTQAVSMISGVARSTSRSPLAAKVIGSFHARGFAVQLVTLTPEPGIDDESAVRSLVNELPHLHEASAEKPDFTIAVGFLGIPGPSSPELEQLARAGIVIPSALTRHGQNPPLDQIVVYPQTSHFANMAGLVDLYQNSPKLLFPDTGLSDQDAVEQLSLRSPAWCLFRNQA